MTTSPNSDAAPAPPHPRPASRRPRARAADSGASAKRILAAATAAFAERGLAGARVDDIASRAGINKRMLYHYFGNKEALYLAVLEHVYAELLDAERTLDLGRAEPIEGIRRLVGFLWQYYLDHPEFLTLINTENLHRARHLRQSRVIREMHSPLVGTLSDLLARGRAAGVFRDGVDPVQLYITCAALAYFYQSNQYTLSTIFGRNLMTPRARMQRVTHLTDVVLGYLAPA